MMEGCLRPKPLQVKRKPRGVRLKDLEPTAGHYLTTPTDLGTTKCSGIMHGGGVLVSQLNHIWALVKLGCYGKELKQVSRKRGAAAAYSEEIESSWRKRLKLHSQWKEEDDGTIGMAEEGVIGMVEGEGMEGATGEGGTGVAGGTTSMAQGGGRTSMAEGEWTTSMAQGEGMISEEGVTVVAKDKGTTAITEEEGTDGDEKTGMGEEEGTDGDEKAGIAEEEGTTGVAKEEGRTNVVKERTTSTVEGTFQTNVDDDYQKFISRLKAIKTEDPYSIEEHLQLGPEEAFYLAAKVGVLTVETDGAGALTNGNLWLHFTSLSRSFCSRYAAYAHYRAGNWVPKSGLKFGVDFLLYKESPLSHHSSFAVIVKEEGGGSEGAEHGSLTWKEIIALGRVSESSKKDLLVCSVTWPKGTSKGEPCCVDTATVTDILVKRWVPEKDR